jgi:hypothetical protein
MFGLGVWTGLAESVFLADVTTRDRDPARLAATVIGGVCVGIVAAIACWTLVLVPYTFLAGLGDEGLRGLGKVAARFEDPDVHDLGITVLRLLETTATDGVFPLAFVALAGIIAGHRLRRYVTGAARVRWRLVLVGLGLATLAMTPLLVVDRLTASAGQTFPILAIAPDWGGRFIYAASALLLIPAAAAEELLFRGWLLRQTAAFTRQSAILIFFPSIIFSAAHFDFNPDAFLTRTLMGVGFAYMTLRLGGLEFSTGAHAANNILIVLFVEPLAFQSTAPPDLTAGAWLEDLALIVGYISITEAVARIGALRRWAGVRLDEITPPAFGAPNFG